MVNCFTFDSNEAELIGKRQLQQQQQQQFEKWSERIEWGVSTYIMGLGLFKRDQIIYNCVCHHPANRMSVQQQKINEKSIKENLISI